jgi:pyruvate dehydrogenase E1 component alpha subunit
MPDPPGTAIFDSVYAETTPELVAQREEFVTYHAGFEAAGSEEGGH